LGSGFHIFCDAIVTFVDDVCFSQPIFAQNSQKIAELSYHKSKDYTLINTFVPGRSAAAMKIQNKLVALSFFHATVAAAFVIQTPRALSFAGSRSMVSDEYAAWMVDQASGVPKSASSTALKANVSETGTSVGTQSPFVNGAAQAYNEAASMRRGMNQSTQQNVQQGMHQNMQQSMQQGMQQGMQQNRQQNRQQPNRQSGAKGEIQLSKADWDNSQIVLQGGSLRTWSETSGAVERVQVMLKTEGRPLNSNVELWHGPDNTPLKMSVYSENGGMRPFSVVIETPRGQNTIAIRNTGQMEFPLNGLINPDVKDVVGQLASVGNLKTMQGGAIQTYPFDHSVGSVQVLLQTGGRPLNARIELLQGPNNDKMVIDIYTEDGLERPFFAIIETPGTGNVVRVVNTAPVEFPLSACVMPYMMDNSPRADESGESGWDNGGASSFLPWGRQA
jgi:hypothetical protein